MALKPLVMPKKIEVDKEATTDRYGRFILSPLERGFGITIGNSLRRILGFPDYLYHVGDLIHHPAGGRGILHFHDLVHSPQTKTLDTGLMVLLAPKKSADQGHFHHFFVSHRLPQDLIYGLTTFCRDALSVCHSPQTI